MTDNIWEEVAYWQQQDEDHNLELINQHNSQQLQSKALLVLLPKNSNGGISNDYRRDGN